MLRQLIHAFSFWRIITILSISLAASKPQVNAYKETMLFEYMPNCAGKEDTLDFHIDEARHLIKAAKHAIDNIAHDIVAQKLVTSYFKIEFVPIQGRAVARHEDWAEWARVKMYIDLVNTFLQTGAYPDKRKKPRLYCGDDILQPFPWDAAAVNADGEYMVNEQNGQYYTIREIYRNFPDKKNQVPYFVTDRNAYYFDSPNMGGCPPGSLGETLTGMPDWHSWLSPVQWTSTLDSEMTFICPEALDETHDFFDYLGETGWIDPDSQTTLDSLVPESGTLYHELFHLVSGRIGFKRGMNPTQYKTRIVGDYSASLAGCLNLDRDRAIMNAETYVYFSLAYWYYYHDWENGKKKITFYPGYAVYWDWPM